MTTFWGVCGSCSHDWYTKVSASVAGLGQATGLDRPELRAGATG